MSSAFFYRGPWKERFVSPLRTAPYREIFHGGH